MPPLCHYSIESSTFGNNVRLWKSYLMATVITFPLMFPSLAYCDEQARRQVSSNNVVMIPPPPLLPPSLLLQVINNPTSPLTPISKIVIIYMCLSSFQWHTINQTPPVNFSPVLPKLTRMHPARGRRRRLTMLRKWWLTTLHLNRNSTITTAGLVSQNNTIPFALRGSQGRRNSGENRLHCGSNFPRPQGAVSRNKRGLLPMPLINRCGMLEVSPAEFNQFRI